MLKRIILLCIIGFAFGYTHGQTYQDVNSQLNMPKLTPVSPMKEK